MHIGSAAHRANASRTQRRHLASGIFVVSRVLFAVVVTFAAVCAFAGVPGTFRGTVHEGGDTKPGWVYVEALNGNLRLVDVRKANIHYEDYDDEPATRNAVPPAKPETPKLKTGTEVRVTAEQDGRGYWHATEVEVLRETSKK